MTQNDILSIKSNGYTVDVELNVTVINENALRVGIDTSTNKRMIGKHSTHFNMDDQSISIFSNLANDIVHMRLTSFMSQSEIEESLGKAVENCQAEKEAFEVHTLICKHFSLECYKIQSQLEKIKIPALGSSETEKLKPAFDLLYARLEELLKSFQSTK